MFASLTRVHHWPPSVLEGLFFDGEDYDGLYFQIEDAHEVAKQIPKPKK
jgi:hypothetical protein